MIATVENKIISPFDGSRIIHECCALLGLPLEEEIPKTTLIVTGMVKTATSEDLKDGFKEFGEIEAVAVAGGERGFGTFKLLIDENVIDNFFSSELSDNLDSDVVLISGIVRYKSPKSVVRAFDKFRTEEVIVQDVAVVIKMLEFEPDTRADEFPTEQRLESPRRAGQRKGPLVAASESDGKGANPMNMDIIGYPHGSLGRHDS